ncbi:extracellular solute-binding protein [Paenibacillus psychroresistens]|uniref:Extracellular solute-binding protein n=1 Tax=Paenibacillus psychroresistens TaxID=1778678 RepID=A0A6B8RH09_9BACL|nr:extracellular solute-binding protein [Paenibacillus psychroresistens]QGQ95014.1 extracellular solute-binding protein [Paenibacillus psychroresistens]
MLMQRVKYRAGFLVIILIVIMALSGCSKDDDLPANTLKLTSDKSNSAAIKLTFAYNWTGADGKAGIYEEMLHKYIDANKNNVIIELEATPGDEHMAKMKVEIASETTPDLFMYWAGSANIKPMVDAQVIVSMEDYLLVSKAVKKQQWSESAWDSFKVGDKHYGLPVESFKGFFMYNKTIFDQYKLMVPKTYTELKQVAKVLRDNHIIPLAMSSKGGNPGHLFYDQIRDQLPDGVSDASDLGSTFKFDTASFRSAAAIIDEMRSNQMFPEDTIENGDWAPSVSTYNEGKAAMIYTFPWMIDAIKPEIVHVSEFADFPKMDNAVKDPAGFTIGGISMGLVINKKSFENQAKQAEIVKFADYLVSDEMFRALGKASMSPAKNVELETKDLNPLFIKYVDFTAKKISYPPVYSTFPTQDTVIVYNYQMDSLFAGAVKPGEFISTIQKAIDYKNKK